MNQYTLEKDPLFPEPDPKRPRYSGRYSPGRIDGGRAFVEWELTQDGRFSMSGEIWDRQGSDCVTAGQCVGEIAAAFPADRKLQRMREIWERWHLNDMKTGSPRQEAWLKAHPVEFGYPESHYEKASAALAVAGLNPDPEFRYTGEGAENVKQEEGYRYGSAWIREDLPPEVVSEVAAWSEAPGAVPEELEPFADFLKSRGITVYLQEIDARPGWEGDPGATHWKATLKMGRARMTCQYSQGSAHTRPPRAGDILRALVSDAQCVDGRTFRDFCAELGYDEDSRKAEKTFRECTKAADRLRRFFGEADYQFCLYGEEADAQ